MVQHITGFLVLYLILSILVQMIPEKKYQKYVRFFAQIVFVIGLLSPVLNLFGAEEAFRNEIQYETFLGEIEQTRRDAEKITYLKNDYYVEQYEQVIETDISQMAEEAGFFAKSVSCSLTDTYEIQSINLEITDYEEDIMIGKITVSSELGETAEHRNNSEDNTAYQKLKEKMLSYYQLSENQLVIWYEES